MSGPKGPRKRPTLWGYLLYDKKLPGKPELLQIASATGLSKGDVLLALLSFWSWVDDHFPTGHIRPGNVRILSQAVSGTSPEFWQEVVRAGWLCECEGGLEIPNFDRWLGYTAKARMHEALRKWLDRHDPNQCPPSVPGENGHSADNGRPKAGSKRPLGKGKGKGKEEPPIPPLLDTEKFKEAWTRWLDYRRERRQSLTPSTMRKQLEKLAAWGPARAVASIEQSITHGWQGLFLPQGGTNGTRGDLGPVSRVDAPEGKYDRLGKAVGAAPLPEGLPQAPPGGDPPAGAH